MSSVLAESSESESSESIVSSSEGDFESLELVIFTAGIFLAVVISIFVSSSRFFRSVC